MSKTIKILYIIDCFENSYAGTEGQLMKLISGLDKEKFTPCLVILRDTFYMKNSDVPVTADVLNIQSLSSVSAWAILYRYLKKKKSEGFMLAHTFFFDASLICPPILKMLGYKILVSRRDMGYWYTAANLAALRVNAWYVDRVIANSEAVKSITIRKEWYGSGRVEVIYNGCQEADSAESKENLVTVGELNIVLVANLRPIKRIEDAIKAIKIINDSELSVALYIIGDGEQSQLVRLSKKLGIESSVRLLGPRDNVLQLLPDFHVGILCSESEGFSNTLIEYMQSSLPVVCSSVGGNTEIVEHGINGFLYKMGDVQMLAKYILELAADTNLRKRMGRAGVDKVKSNYNLAKYIDLHQNLYDELLSS